MPGFSPDAIPIPRGRRRRRRLRLLASRSGGAVVAVLRHCCHATATVPRARPATAAPVPPCRCVPGRQVRKHATGV
jgi:hypothetical protein